ncbi:MAG: hypothetical protein ABSH06_15305 [Thermodesulfobacteriota bacterium]|jgi:hypothetical protein
MDAQKNDGKMTALEKKEAGRLLEERSLLYQIGEDIQRAGVAGEKGMD